MRNRKMVWKHRSYLLIFLLVNLKYLVWPYREYTEIAQNGSFCEELRRDNDIEAVLVHFCCNDYGANASEEVRKITTRTLEFIS